MATGMIGQRVNSILQLGRLSEYACRPLYSIRYNSSLADQFAEAQKSRQHKPAFRTSVPPGKQTKSQEAMFYTVPKEDMVRSLSHAFSRDYSSQIKTFMECSIMVREPGLEIINYLKQTDFKHIPMKYVLFGKKGVGKTVTMAHVMHYCAAEGWLIAHFPWPHNWNNRFREVNASSYAPSRIDLPIESVEWLKTFRSMNLHLIEEHNLVTKFRYEWSKRESLEIGSSFSELIEYGISRPKYASDCIGAILKELRRQSSTLPCKILFAVDGVNALWAPTTLKDEEHKNVPIDRYSLVHNMKKMFNNDWTNGAILLSVDYNISPIEKRSSYFPKFLLGKEAFKILDPYVPVCVKNYNVKELTSCLDYYDDRLWIQSESGRSDEGRKEMAFMTEGNPLALYNLCSAW